MQPVTPHAMMSGAVSESADRDIRVNNTPGIDPMDFVRANRIHVQHGSLFIDPYLVLHPRELAPQHDEALRKKLFLTYSINNPSFYEKPKRTAVALHLAQMIPVSMEAKRSHLMDEIKKFNEQLNAGGTDADLTRQIDDKHHPFAAVVRDTMRHPEVDPVGMEMLKNGIAAYLLVREKLSQNHYLHKVTEYTPRLNNTDQVLTSLADKIGVSPIAMREAALKGGVDGIGQLLKLDPAYVQEVKALANHLAERDFGYNIIEHWHIGRQLLGGNATLEQKITTGLDARITAKSDEYRRAVKEHYDIPEPLHAEEKRIAQALALVSPIQRKLMYALGYEICFSPEVTADEIAFHKGIYGLHRKAANDLNDYRGTYRIYFSGKGDLEGSMRTLVHEVAHNLWPQHFTPEQVASIDQLAAADTQRFATFSKLMQERYPEFERAFNAYKAAPAEQKAAKLAEANATFAAYGVTFDGLFPHLRDAHKFMYMVEHAATTLDVEGERYSRSGYDSPQERFREVISRFAELKQVRYRESPELLAYLAPGLTQMFDNHYLPHLEKVYAQVMQEKPPGLPASDMASDSAVAPEAPKVREQPKPPLAMQNASVSVSPHAIALDGKGASMQLNPDAMAALSALRARGIQPNF